jgi:hypothetical protein
MNAISPVESYQKSITKATGRLYIFYFKNALIFRS